MTSTQYLDKTQQGNIQRVTRVVRSSYLSKMSESDSNSERSYDSEDSEYNFIPGNVNIGEIEVEDHGNLGNNNGVTGLHSSHPCVIAS